MKKLVIVSSSILAICVFTSVITGFISVNVQMHPDYFRPSSTEISGTYTQVDSIKMCMDFVELKVHQSDSIGKGQMASFEKEFNILENKINDIILCSSESFRLKFRWKVKKVINAYEDVEDSIIQFEFNNPEEGLEVGKMMGNINNKIAFIERLVTFKKRRV